MKLTGRRGHKNCKRLVTRLGASMIWNVKTGREFEPVREPGRYWDQLKQTRPTPHVGGTGGSGGGDWGGPGVGAIGSSGIFPGGGGTSSGRGGGVGRSGGSV